MNKVSNLLLESIIESDPLFVELINNMIIDKTTDISISHILTFLSDILSNDKDIETKYNYINISDKNDEISFIPNSQYNKFISNKENLSTKTKNFTKIGRFIKQLYKDNGKNITDDQVEKFVNNYKSKYNEYYKTVSEFEIKIVSGDEIKKWYNWKSYYGNEFDCGELWKSCMRHDICGDFFDIYVNNPTKISLVILIKNDKLIARALLWYINKNIVYLDRIYGYKKSDEHLLKKLIVNDKFKDKKVYLYDIDDINNIKIPISIRNIEKFPYLDSFSTMYVELNDGIEDHNFAILMNQNEHTNGFIRYNMKETNGNRTYEDSDYYNYSEYHGKYIKEEDSVYVELIGKNGKMEGKKEGLYFKDETIWSDYLKKFILKEDAIYLDSIKDYYIIDDIINDKEFGKIPNNSLCTIYYDYKEQYKNITPIQVYSMNNDKVDVEHIFISKRGIRNNNNSINYNGYTIDKELVEQISLARVTLKCETLPTIQIRTQSLIHNDIIPLCSGTFNRNDMYLLLEDFNLLKDKYNLNIDNNTRNMSIYEFINNPNNDIFDYKKTLQLLKGSSKNRIKILNFKNIRLRRENVTQIIYNDIIKIDRLFILKFTDYYFSKYKNNILEKLNDFYTLRNNIQFPTNINIDDIIKLIKMIIIISLKHDTKYSVKKELDHHIMKFDSLLKISKQLDIDDIILFLSYEDIIFDIYNQSIMMDKFLENTKSEKYNNSGKKILNNILSKNIEYDDDILFKNLCK